MDHSPAYENMVPASGSSTSPQSPPPANARSPSKELAQQLTQQLAKENLVEEVARLRDEKKAGEKEKDFLLKRIQQQQQQQAAQSTSQQQQQQQQLQLTVNPAQAQPIDLYMATRNGDEKLVMQLLYSFDTSERKAAQALSYKHEAEHDDTLLHAAVRSGNARLVEMLYHTGFRADVPNRDGMTPLDIAKDSEMMKILSILSFPPSSFFQVVTETCSKASKTSTTSAPPPPTTPAFASSVQKDAANFEPPKTVPPVNQQAPPSVSYTHLTAFAKGRNAAKSFWVAAFKDTTEVVILNAFKQHFDWPDVSMVEHLLCNPTDTSPFVHRDHFINVVGWFNKLFTQNDPDSQQEAWDILHSPWFHADILSGGEAVTRLANMARNGDGQYYLVRPSTTDPYNAPFSLTSLNSNNGEQVVKHLRIQRKAGQYFVEWWPGTVESPGTAFSNLPFFIMTVQEFFGVPAIRTQKNVQYSKDQ